MARLSLLLATILMLSPSYVACAQSTVAVQYLFSALNQERTSGNLSPLRFDAALTQAATAHARLMAEHETISHRFSNEPELSARCSEVGAHFDRITENVAEGSSAVKVHDAWMHSPGHRANILDPEVDAVGIAIVVRNQQIYAVQDFQRSVKTLTLEQQEASVGVLLDRAGLELVPGRNARETCAMSTGYAGTERPDFVIRYTTTNLAILPSQLQTRLAKSQDHRAAVGACTSMGKSDFSNYSIAVLLFP